MREAAGTTCFASSRRFGLSSVDMQAEAELAQALGQPLFDRRTDHARRGAAEIENSDTVDALRLLGGGVLDWDDEREDQRKSDAADIHGTSPAASPPPQDKQ